MTMPLSSADIYLDSQGLSQLRRSAGERSDDALKAVAEQFEALFIQQMLKTMRDAKLAEGLFDNDQSELYIDLHDKQLAINLAKANGLGLSDMIVEQLGRHTSGEKGSNVVNRQGVNRQGIDGAGTGKSNEPANALVAPMQLTQATKLMQPALPMPAPTTPIPAGQPLTQTVDVITPVTDETSTLQEVVKLADYSQLLSGVDSHVPSTVYSAVHSTVAAANQQTLNPPSAPIKDMTLGLAVKGDEHYRSADTFASPTTFNSPENFVSSLWPFAQKAAQELGVAPKVLLAQAALETGWGKAVNKHADGRSSYNLFNIKANGAWSGESVVVSTLEYEDGLARREKALFRSYSSFQDSFDDYVAFIKQNPRYQSALAKASDSQAYAHELQQAGYATDPEYSLKIIKIINGEPMEKAINQLKLSFNETISAMNRSGK